MSRKNAQRSINENLTHHQQLRRERRMTQRATTRIELQNQINFLGNALFGFAHMNFWARLKWVVVGAPKGKA